MTAAGPVGALQLLDAIRDARGISSMDKLVLAMIAAHTSRSSECFASRGTLADETGLHVDTMKRLLQSLRERGLVLSVPRLRPNGSQTSNALVIDLEALNALRHERNVV